MNFINQTISIHYARQFVQSARTEGYDVEAILRAASINEEMLEADDMRITPAQLATLIRTGWEVADDELFGMANYKCKKGIFGLMATQTVYYKSLREVYKFFCYFYHLVTDAFEWSLSENGDNTVLSLKLATPNADQYNVVVDFYLLIAHRFPSWLIGSKIPLAEVHLNFPRPEHADEYRLLFPAPIRYEQPYNALVFPTQILDAPVVQTRETLKDHLEQLPLEWFTRQHYYSTYTRVVLDQLTDSGELNNLQIEDIAEALNMTSRTLRRKLADEKTSFQDIKQSARRDIAIHLLSLRKIPVSQIALRLGYSDTASFSRAFKAWTGVTPNSYKAPLS